MGGASGLGASQTKARPGMLKAAAKHLERQCAVLCRSVALRPNADVLRGWPEVTVGCEVCYGACCVTALHTGLSVLLRFPKPTASHLP